MVEDDLNALGAKIIQDAKANVSVKTGALKKSLNYSVEYDDNDNFKIVINELEYGKFLDKGTKNMKAEPFLTPAITKNLPMGIKNITKSLTEDILENFKKIDE